MFVSGFELPNTAQPHYKILRLGVHLYVYIAFRTASYGPTHCETVSAIKPGLISEVEIDSAMSSRTISGGGGAGGACIGGLLVPKHSAGGEQKFVAENAEKTELSVDSEAERAIMSTSNHILSSEASLSDVRGRAHLHEGQVICSEPVLAEVGDGYHLHSQDCDAELAIESEYGKYACHAQLSTPPSYLTSPNLLTQIKMGEMIRTI